jgi:hypothetical protein
MKRHDFIQTVVRAEMSDKEKIREACLNQNLDWSKSGELQNRKEQIFMKRTMKWLAPVAACLVFALTVVIVPNLFNQNPTSSSSNSEDKEVTTSNPGGEEDTPLNPGVEDINIYYVNEQGSIVFESVNIRLTAKDIFAKWAELNNIQGVSLVKCFIDNNGTETLQGDPNDPNAVVGYNPGDYTVLRLTLSQEFNAYLGGANGQLLVESLKNTFYDYDSFDDFDLIINTPQSQAGGEDIDIAPAGDEHIDIAPAD